MIALALLTVGLLVDAPPPDAASIRSSYETKRAAAGRDPSEHIKLALWCESHGLAAERLRHLAIAVIANPSNLTARGLMGLVSDDGAWRKPEDVADRAKADIRLSADRTAYQELRSKLKDDADSQARLAAWCEEHGLHAEATAHLNRVVRLDPKRESAWRALGYKKYAGIWMTDAQVAAAKAEAEAQAKADHRWRPILERAKAGADGGKPRPEAGRMLAAIRDVHAVPMVMAVFGKGAAGEQKIAAAVLGQIDSPAAKRALAILAVVGKSPEVRRMATETLGLSDPREYAGLLIGQLRDPIRYTVKRVSEPGKPGELWVEGARYDRKRLYQSTAMPKVDAGQGDAITRDADGNKVVVRALSSFDTGVVTGSDLFFFTPWSNSTWYANTAFSQQVSPGAFAALGSQAAHSPLGAQGPKIVQQLAQAAQSQSNSAQHMAAFYRSDNNALAGYGYGFGYSMDPYSQLGVMALQADAALTAAGQNPFALVHVNPGSRIDMTVGTEARIPVGRMEVEALKSASAAQRQLDADVAAIEAFNTPIHARNTRILAALAPATGLDFGEDRKAWMSWFVDQIGYSLIQPQATARETVVDSVQPYDPRVPIQISNGVLSYSRVSCFGAGTLVRTLNGDRPIETLEVGDLVLAQDESTGALSYRPILVVHRNPPASTLKIDLGGESIISSTYHRFWKPGVGWAMARELKPGDKLRTLGGVATVAAVSPEKVQPVFNLDVAEARTFFVGQAGTLAHDNSVPDRRVTPFDAAPAD